MSQHKNLEAEGSTGKAPADRSGTPEWPPKSPVTPRTPIHTNTDVKKIKEKYERASTPEQPERDRVRKGDQTLKPEQLEIFEKGNEEDSRSRSLIERGNEVKKSSMEGLWGQEDIKANEVSRNITTQQPERVPLQATLDPPLPSLPLIPKHVSAFEYALAHHLDANPECKAHLAASSTMSSPASSLPSQGSSLHSGEISARSSEAHPQIHFESIAAYLKDKDETELRLKILHVRTLLQRCAVLWSTAHALEHAEWPNGRRERGKPGYMVFSMVGRAAEKAELIAKEIGINGLQARCWYWMGKADGARRYWDDAAMAFAKAVQFNPPVEEGVSGIRQYGSSGLTPLERSDVDFLRERMEEKTREKDEQALEWRSGRAEAKYVRVREGIAEGEMEAEEELREEGQMEPEVRKYERSQEELSPLEELRNKWSALRETRVMQPLEPLSPEEEDYILYGMQ